MMMSEKRDKGFIKLVYSKDDHSHAHIERREKALSGQLSMFPSHSPNMIVFVTSGQLDEGSFTHLLDSIHPSYFIDLRSAPRFDYGALNRIKAFDLFDTSDVTYFDLDPSDLAAFEILIKKSTEKTWAGSSGQFKKKIPQTYFGPLVFVLDENANENSVKETVVDMLNNMSKKDWDILEYSDA